ncbi:hypothetical protein R1flu_006743 [Riccia fluitans]|uniref:Uncharacterized protein n=1 Tax=Riccia fluitans TaxID=41844 RepID=A0ABD1YXZ3_9MARC
MARTKAKKVGGGIERQGHYADHLVDSGVFGRRDDELKDRSMKDQKLYLISRQDQRVGFPLLTAIELSDRLEEFVTCMMKIRSTLKTSLFFLLELKAYPVNTSTHILQVVVRFCQAKLALDRAGLRYNNVLFMSAAEERSYWISFLWRDLEASASLLQVAKDLGIKTLSHVIHLIHEPAPGAVFKSPTIDLSFEERRTLLRSSSLASSSTSGWVKAPAASYEHHQKVKEEKARGTHLRSQTQCVPRLFKLTDCGSLLLRKFTSCEEDPEDKPVGLLPEELPEGTDGTNCCCSSSTNSLEFERVLTLSELMRLESVVETVSAADDLSDVISRLSKKFDAISVSELCKLHEQTCRTQGLSRNWSYTEFSNKSREISSGEASSTSGKASGFHISPEIDDSASAADRVESTKGVSQDTEAGEILCIQEPSMTTEQAKRTQEVPHYVSLGIKESTRQKLLNVVKATARILAPRKTGYSRIFWHSESSKEKMSSALPSAD